MKFNTMPLAFKYCVGHGIELGAAAHNPFDLPNCLFVGCSDGVDYLYPEDLADYEFFRDSQVGMSGELVKIDMVGDFQHLDVEDEKFDYVISSHVIEHVPNVIAALVESYRVLKNGGIFFVIFPKRNAGHTDAVRPLTTLAEMIETYEAKIDMGCPPQGGWRTHYQVFSTQSMIGVINYINNAGLGNWLIECVEETDTKVTNGHTLVLRKTARLQEARWPYPDAYSDVVNEMVEKEEFRSALNVIKGSLSFDFFDHIKLYLAAMLSVRVNERHEGIEFLRQALIVDPENGMYRQEFLDLAGVAYVNPVL